MSVACFALGLGAIWGLIYLNPSIVVLCQCMFVRDFVYESVRSNLAPLKITETPLRCIDHMHCAVPAARLLQHLQRLPIRLKDHHANGGKAILKNKVWSINGLQDWLRMLEKSSNIQRWSWRQLRSRKWLYYVLDISYWETQLTCTMKPILIGYLRYILVKRISMVGGKNLCKIQ